MSSAVGHRPQESYPVPDEMLAPQPLGDVGMVPDVSLGDGSGAEPLVDAVILHTPGPTIELDPRIAILQGPESTEVEREEASKDLFYEFFPLCQRIAGNILHDEGEALDSAMQAIDKVIRHSDKYKPTAALQAWISTIATNNAIHKYRSARLRRDVSDVGFDHAVEDDPRLHDTKDNVEEDVFTDAAMTDLLQRLRGVNSDFLRTLILLAQGYHYLEIAEIEDIPLGTVMSRIARGRKAAQAVLKASPDFSA